MQRHRLIIFTAAAMLSSCMEEPVSVQSSDNPGIPVEHLLTIDGCKVYRFQDGRSHYLTTCPAASVSSSHTESCGKNCTRTVVDDIQTVATR